MNNKRVFKFFYYLGLIGILGGLGYLLYNSYIYQGSNEIIGSVSELIEVEKDNATVYKTVYTYTGSDELTGSGTSSSTSSHPMYDVGDPIKLLNHEGSVFINDFFSLWLGPLIIIVSSMMFCGIGWYMSSMTSRKMQLKEKLKLSGNKVVGKLISIEDSYVSVNNTKLKYAQVEYQDPISGKIRIFESEYLYENPLIAKDAKIDVYISTTDENEYVVDLENL